MSPLFFFSSKDLQRSQHWLIRSRRQPETSRRNKPNRQWRRRRHKRQLRAQLSHQSTDNWTRQTRALRPAQPLCPRLASPVELLQHQPRKVLPQVLARRRATRSARRLQLVLAIQRNPISSRRHHRPASSRENTWPRSSRTMINTSSRQPIRKAPLQLAALLQHLPLPPRRL